MSRIEFAPPYPEVATFDKDGRKPLHELYETYFKLLKYGWHCELICYQDEKQTNGEILHLPICAFISPKQNKGTEDTLYGINLIHGEEPATAQASANEIETIAALPDLGIPAIFIFAANPSGYHRDSRYFNAMRDRKVGKSVGDPDHLLLGRFIKMIPPKIFPTSKVAYELAKWILETSKERPPFLVMDHHEDELQKKSEFADGDYYYSYAYGDPKILDLMCPQLASILEKSGYRVRKRGTTRFGEKIKNGFVKNSMDRSLDEFFVAKKYVDRFRLKDKPAAKIVFVPETIIHHTNPQSIAQRASIHQEIIRAYPEFWKILKELE